MRYFQSNQESTSTTRDAGVNPETELTFDVGHEPQVPKGSEIETGAQHESSTQDPSQTAMVSHEKVYSSPWYRYIVEKLTSLVENKDAIFSVKHEKGELVDKLIRLLEKEKHTQEIDQANKLIWLLKQEKKEKHAIQKELQKERKLRVCIQGEEQQTMKNLMETTAKLEKDEAKLKQLELEKQRAQSELKEEQEQHKATKAILASKEQEIAELRVRVEEKDGRVQQVKEKLEEEIEKFKTLHELILIIANSERPQM